jgi:hypothetical protein
MADPARSSFAERILAALASQPGLTDRELTNLLLGRATHPSQVNQECRLLAGRGVIVREKDAAGTIRNRLSGQPVAPVPAPPPQWQPPPAPRS